MSTHVIPPHHRKRTPPLVSEEAHLQTPRIGVTLSQKNAWPAWMGIAAGVRLAGGKPVALTAETYEEKRDALDGFIISGGIDLCPVLYDETPKPGYKYEPERDKMEEELFFQMEHEHKPILGICRGAQLINVMRGGSIHMDIQKVFERAEYPSHLLAKVFYRKPIETEPETRIRALMGCQRCKVNSMHTQAIKEEGQNLHVTSREPNGIVQSIEDPTYPFLLGVQFHPEFMLYRARSRRIFRALVEASKPGTKPSV